MKTFIRDVGTDWLTVLRLIYRLTPLTVADRVALELMGQRRLIQNSKK